MIRFCDHDARGFGDLMIQIESFSVFVAMMLVFGTLMLKAENFDSQYSYP